MEIKQSNEKAPPNVVKFRTLEKFLDFIDEGGIHHELRTKFDEYSSVMLDLFVIFVSLKLAKICRFAKKKRH